MRKLVVVSCLMVALLASSGVAGAAPPTTGTLSVEGGVGVVMLDFRGSALGRLTSGTIRVTDHTPTDRYAALVVGRKLTQERVGPRTVVYRGQGLRFRMLGGGYKIVVRGIGISVSAVGRGNVMLDAEPRFQGDDAGVYSRDDAVDCSVEPESCTPMPTEPERFALEPPTINPVSQGRGAP